MGQFGIGQPVRRFEDKRLLTGFGRFQHDVALPGQAHGYVLRSQHAHALIRSIDLTAVRAAPGVLAIHTGEDLAAAGLGTMGVPFQRKRPDGSPMFWRAHRGLAEGRVRHVGEPVVFVVAETASEARDAAELIDIDYEILLSVTDTAEAAAGKIPVWDECPDNISNLFETGNKEATDAAFARAAHVVKRRYVISRVYAHFMEPRGAVGVWDPGRGPLHALCRRAVSAPRAAGARDAHLQGAGEPYQGDRRRCRRRVRHEGLAVPGAPARAVRGEAAAPAG